MQKLWDWVDILTKLVMYWCAVATMLIVLYLLINLVGCAHETIEVKYSFTTEECESACHMKPCYRALLINRACHCVRDDSKCRLSQ